MQQCGLYVQNIGIVFDAYDYVVAVCFLDRDIWSMPSMARFANAYSSRVRVDSRKPYPENLFHDWLSSIGDKFVADVAQALQNNHCLFCKKQNDLASIEGNYVCSVCTPKVRRQF